MDSQNKREFNRQLDQSHGSFELVLSPVILGLVGWWLDGRFGSGPWMTIGAAALGLVGATIKIVFVYRAKMAKLADERSASRPPVPASRIAA